MGNQFSLVQAERDEAEYRRLREDVERAEQSSFQRFDSRPTNRTSAFAHATTESRTRRNLGSFNPFTGVFDQTEPVIFDNGEFSIDVYGCIHGHSGAHYPD